MEGENLEQNNSEQVKIDEVVRMKNYFRSLGIKMIDAYNEIYKIGAELEKKYPNFRDFYLYHLMIGSNDSELGRRAFSLFDFPGEDSIVKKLSDLCNRYKAE